MKAAPRPAVIGTTDDGLVDFDPTNVQLYLRYRMRQAEGYMEAAKKAGNTFRRNLFTSRRDAYLTVFIDLFGEYSDGG